MRTSVGQRSLERTVFYLGIGVAAALLAAYSVPIWQGRIYIRDDLGIAYGPMRFLFARSLADGSSVLWTNAMFGGHYLHAEGAVAMFHPLHPLLYRAFSLPVAFGLEILMTFVFAMAGSYGFLRHWAIRRDAAMLGAIVFAFSGFQSLHAVHPTMVAVAAHTPWLLWATEVALFGTEARRIAWARLGVTLTIGSQLLLAHPQAFWISGLSAAAYAVLRLPSRPPWGRIAAVAVSAGLGLLIGGIQILPMWEAVVVSSKAPELLNPYRSSLPPTNFVQLVAPYLTSRRVIGLNFTQEYGLYAGALTTVAAAWLIARRVPARIAHPLQRVAVWLAALSILLMLGRYGPLYWMLTYLPVVGRFEHPAQYIANLHFALAVLTALAFAELAERAGSSAGEPGGRGILAAVVLAGVAVAGVALFSGVSPEWTRGDGTRFASPALVIAGLLLVACAAALVWSALRGSRVALGLIVVFVGVDLGVYGLSYLRDPAPLPPQLAFQGQARPPDESGRVESYNNFLLFGGVQLTAGYAALDPRPILPELQPARLRLMGVHWVQARTPWGRGPSLSTTAKDAAHLTAGGVVQTHDGLGGTSDWARIDDPMPRARLVTDTVVSRTPAQDVDRIDIRRTALVDVPLAVQPGMPGRAEVLDDRPGRIRVALDGVGSPQLLVLTETWHPGWTATADGRAIPCQPAYGSLLSCVVSPGQTEIALRFFPPTLRYALVTAAGAFAAALCWCAVTRRGAA